MAGSEIMHTEDVYYIIKILEVDIGVTSITEEIMGIILEVVRDIGKSTMIRGGTIIEVKIMIETGVGH